MVFSHHWIDILGEKSYWWDGGWPVGLYCQLQSHSFSSGLWTLDFGFWNWILYLDFGLGFWTGLNSYSCSFQLELCVGRSEFVFILPGLYPAAVLCF